MQRTNDHFCEACDIKKQSIVMKLQLCIAILTYATLSQTVNGANYCELTPIGEVFLHDYDVFNHTAAIANGDLLFAPNSLHPKVNGIYYDENCVPDCGLNLNDTYRHDRYRFGQIGLYDFWNFDDDKFKAFVAVPKRAFKNHFYFTNANGSIIEDHKCLTFGGCTDSWQNLSHSHKHHYNHSCYDTYGVSANWAILSQSYEPVTVGHQQTYNGAVGSSTFFRQDYCDNEGCHAVDIGFESTVPFAFKISTVLTVDASLSGIRIYQPAKVIAYEYKSARVFTEFRWGFEDNDKVRTAIEINIQTRIKAGTHVDVTGMSAVNFDGTKRVVSVDAPDSCNRIAGDYDSAAEDCVQRWLIELVPSYEDCQVNTTVNATFEFNCDEAFLEQTGGECPQTRGVSSNLVYFAFDFLTDDWCEMSDIAIDPPVANMESFHSATCDSAIHFSKQETIYYEVGILSTSQLTITDSKINKVEFTLTCHVGELYEYETVVLYLNGAATPEFIDITVIDAPASDTICSSDKSTAETVKFSVGLGHDYITSKLPDTGSCTIEAEVLIELQFGGFGMPQLLSVELEDAQFGQNDFPISMGSITLKGQISNNNEGPGPSDDGSASTVSAAGGLVLAAVLSLLL